MTINFTISRTDGDLIAQIVERAYERDPSIIQLDLNMDITACHANGCELKLAELLVASFTDFAHDVYGIRRHIDRKSGQLINCFLPRYAVQK